MLTEIIDQAYKLYMPQVKSEITDLAVFVDDCMTHTTDLYAGIEIEVPVPFNVLEIGTKYGGTFYIWNELVRRHGAGMCVSIDMNDGGQHGGIDEKEMDRRDLWFLERFDNCHFIRGDSHNITTVARLQQLFEPAFGYMMLNSMYSSLDLVSSVEKIDFLFIDGDHTYEGVKKDYEMYSPFVRPGGSIVFHDINDTEYHRSRNVYVGKFWNEIKDQYEEHYEFNAGGNWAGIGVLVKPCEEV